MRIATKNIFGLFLFACVCGPMAGAQLPHFEHIIIVVQENRTPDNLFGSPHGHLRCGQAQEFEPGVDIQNGGFNKETGKVDCLRPISLGDTANPNHMYFPAWVNQYDHGKMDGACENPKAGASHLKCPQYTYVKRKDVEPYFDIAMNYGYANYMFQTNEGPSFPAHQVIFSGTSAPVPPGDFFGNDRNFVAENPLGKASNKDTGCDDLRRERALWVDPTGTEFDPGRPLDEPCYHHDSLVTLLDAHGKTWRYYTPIPGKIWTAPTAITDICGPVINGLCRGPDYANVVWPAKVGVPVPIYDDIKHCNLPQVSWAIPDEKWSDHPGRDNDKGPSYVANLVNLVGESRCVDSNGKTYWHNTAILITWDDWGGWFDHVLPPTVYRQGNTNCNLQWGCGNVYGFRVPLLVVSAYTPKRYVSGALPSPGMDPQHTHDFGSILRFVENNFGLGQIAPPFYADDNAPDADAPFGSLGDFFQGHYRAFKRVPHDRKYSLSYFIHYLGPAQGPDGDEQD